jgi:hypothetical protein
MPGPPGPGRFAGEPVDVLGVVDVPEPVAFEAAPLVAIPPAAPISAQAVATESSPAHRFRAIVSVLSPGDGRVIATCPERRGAA